MAKTIKKMLINLTNHPAGKWSEAQIEAAKKQYGTVLDMQFPAIEPKATSKEVKLLTEEYFEKLTTILDECANEPQENAVHIQGEFTFVFNLVNLLKSSKIKCLASTSERKVIFEDDGKKTLIFNFVQFREY